MASTFRCRLVTPAARVFDQPVASAVVPLWDGLMGFLPGRAPILGKLGCGELRLEFGADAKGTPTSYFVDGGVLQMAGNELTILAERASPTAEINLTEEEARLSKLENETVSVDDPAHVTKIERHKREIRAAREKIRLARERRGNS